MVVLLWSAAFRHSLTDDDVDGRWGRRLTFAQRSPVVDRRRQTEDRSGLVVGAHGWKGRWLVNVERRRQSHPATTAWSHPGSR